MPKKPTRNMTARRDPLRGEHVEEAELVEPEHVGVEAGEDEEQRSRATARIAGGDREGRARAVARAAGCWWTSRMAPGCSSGESAATGLLSEPASCRVRSRASSARRGRSAARRCRRRRDRLERRRARRRASRPRRPSSPPGMWPDDLVAVRRRARGTSRRPRPARRTSSAGCRRSGRPCRRPRSCRCRRRARRR